MLSLWSRVLIAFSAIRLLSNNIICNGVREEEENNYLITELGVHFDVATHFGPLEDASNSGVEVTLSIGLSVLAVIIATNLHSVFSCYDLAAEYFLRSKNIRSNAITASHVSSLLKPHVSYIYARVYFTLSRLLSFIYDCYNYYNFMYIYIYIYLPIINIHNYTLLYELRELFI